MRAIAILAIGCAAAGLACAGGAPSDREVRLGRLATEHRALMNQLDDLQARLLVSGQRVRFWEEMRSRHESVSAIACTSQEAHAVAMAESLQQIERRPAARARARVASLRSGPTSAPARR